jgi:chromosome segregation ATPase
LAKLAPDQVDLALKENVEIKVEFQTVRQELKRYKRLLLEAERAIELAKTERDQLLEQKSLSEERTSSGLQAEMRKARDQLAVKDKSIQSLESELQRLKDRLERFSSKDNLSKIVSSHASRNHTRHSLSNQSVDEWLNQEQMMEIKNLRNELTEERQLKEDLLGDNQDLRHRLIETKNALQDTQDEIQRISRVEEHGYRSHQISRAQSRFEEDPDDYLSSGRKSTLTSISTGGASNQKLIKEFKREIQDLERQLRELENENIELRSQVNAQVKMLSTKNSEKDKLQDQVINLKRKVLDLQDELDQDAREFQKIQQAGHTNLHDQTADEVREVSQTFSVDLFRIANRGEGTTLRLTDVYNFVLDRN